jgi:enamine deaminase RidA (YjgF/YER057c/UK114 family)
MIRQYHYTAQALPNFSECLRDCVNNLNAYILQNTALGVIFFIDSKTDADYFLKKREIVKVLDEREFKLPYNIQAQSCNSLTSIEVWVDDSASTVEYRCSNGTRYTRATSTFGKTIWGFGLTSNQEQLPLVEQILFSFETALQILETEGLTLSDIVRQWNYIPGILDMREVEGKSIQHYQEFNEVRQKYYSTTAFRDGYPSATGIGTRNGNYDLDFFAVKSSTAVQKFGLSNPKQQDAYKYDQMFLVGDTLSGHEKKTPLFERAKLLKSEKETTIFISGTASIIGQETIGIDDVRRQTAITIDNMQELIPIQHNQSIRYTYLRAYIKEVKDFPAVRTICEERFPGVSISYLQADVCRTNLLVEIEGAGIVNS